jgi:hypothetical protein
MNCFIQDDFGDERETNLAAVIAASSSSGQSDIVSHTSASMNILLNDVILCCFWLILPVCVLYYLVPFV